MTNIRPHSYRAELLAKLKEWLREKEASFHWEEDWCGNTEEGFHSEPRFDFDKLCEEIDAFAATLKKEERK